MNNLVEIFDRDCPWSGDYLAANDNHLTIEAQLQGLRNGIIEAVRILAETPSQFRDVAAANLKNQQESYRAALALAKEYRDMV